MRRCEGTAERGFGLRGVEDWGTGMNCGRTKKLVRLLDMSFYRIATEDAGSSDKARYRKPFILTSSASETLDYRRSPENNTTSKIIRCDPRDCFWSYKRQLKRQTLRTWATRLVLHLFTINYAHNIKMLMRKAVG